jgi:hypothetical protein
MRKSLSFWVFPLVTLLLSLNFWILSFPTIFSCLVPSTIGYYLVGTIILVSINLAFLGISHTYNLRLEEVPSPSGNYRFPFVLSLLSGIIITAGCYRLMEQVLYIPIDPNRADMLPVIQKGIGSFLNGFNPYQVYKLPWNGYLAYGPVLWGPYIIPDYLRIDLRLLGLLCTLILPSFCAFVSIALAVRGAFLHSLFLLALVFTLCHNNATIDFMAIAHTPVYWPLILFFCYTLSKGRWLLASLTLGLLIGARTTMIATIPVFFLYVFRNDRRKFIPCLLIFGATVLTIFLPFIIWDDQMLYHSMVGNYLVVVKPWVWYHQREWINHTFGITAYLLSRHWEAYLPSIQAILLLPIYALTWRYAKHPQILKWMATALFAFSLTSFWPISYIYLDVFTFFTSAFLVEYGTSTKWLRNLKHVAIVVPVLFVFGLIGFSSFQWGQPYEIDVGNPKYRRNLGNGFSHDEVWSDSGRTVCWVEGEKARIYIPRVWRSAGRLKMVCIPYSPTPKAQQSISITLNDMPLGTKRLETGWNTIDFLIPGEAWKIGNNVLDFRFSYALSPKELGLSNDSRRLSVAFDRIILSPP